MRMLGGIDLGRVQLTEITMKIPGKDPWEANVNHDLIVA